LTKPGFNLVAMTLPEALQQIEKLFADVPPSALKAIPMLGCCDMHAEDFEWYREHEWKDLRKELRDSGGDHRKAGDPFQFGSLDPVAFHYFLPGVLTGIADLAIAQPRSEDEFDYATLNVCFNWLQNVTPIQSCRDRFIAEQLPLFNEKERWAIRNFLSIFASYLEESPSVDKEDICGTLENIDEALREVWK